MKIHNWFGFNPKEEKRMIPVDVPQELSEQKEEKMDSTQKEEPSENKQKIITIKWGTGMPIDVIFNFIHKDFEDEGYQDALVNSDLQYREAKEGIIRNDLKMLFKRISLRYKNDIREIEVQMRNAQESYAMSSAS